MRILMITQFFSPTIGGQERLVEDLGVELAARGHQVAVATLQQEGQPRFSSIGQVPVYRIQSTTGRLFRGYVDPSRHHAPPAIDPMAAAGLGRVVNRWKPDIVHGHDWLIHSFLPSKRRHGPRLVMTLHDQSLVCANKRLIRRGEACEGPGPLKCLNCSASHYGLAKGPIIAASNWVMSSGERALVDMFLPVSKAVAVAARLQDHGDPHRIIPNFLPARTQTNEPEERLAGLPERFLLFAGDVARDKGVEVLLEAHALLEDPPPLVLIGRIVDADMLARIVGPERAASPALLAAPIGKVRAVGVQPHEVVLDAFRRCTAAVVPSLTPEAFGLVALEAMSASRAVIASEIGGLRDIITHGENGILVPPGDVHELHTALARVTKDSALRAKIGAAAERRAGDFTASTIVPQVEQVYEDVVTARRSRTGRISAARGKRMTGLAAAFRQAWSGLHGREPQVLLGLTALGVAAMTISSTGWSPLRTVLVLPLVLVLPGFALTGAIFGNRAPALVERAALALGLSLVAAALVSLVLYLLQIELTLYSWAATLAFVTAAATIIGAARRSSSPAAAPPLRRVLSLRRSWVALGVGIAAAGFAAAAVVLARTPLPSPSAAGYTALWLTRESRSAALTVGVRSEEHRKTRYVLRLTLPRGTSERRLALAPGQTWQETLPPARRAAADLYRVGRRGVYRSVSLAAPRAAGR